MNFIGPLLVIVAALVALSGFIIAKKPELKSTFDKIAPYQGFLGVGLLAWGVYDLYHNVIQTYAFGKSRWGLIFSGIEMGGMHSPTDKLAGIALLGYIICEILLGFMLGFGLIATWIPGESGAEKGAVKIQKKLLGLSLPIGIAGVVFAILWLIKMPSGY
jgi:hypothetical protein